MPALLALGLSVPDPDLYNDEAKGTWIHGQIGWDEFWRVIDGDGPCNEEPLAARRQAHDDGRLIRCL